LSRLGSFRRYDVGEIRRIGTGGKSLPLTERQAQALVDLLADHEQRLLEAERKIEYMMKVLGELGRKEPKEIDATSSDVSTNDEGVKA
jgi:hypothetical protein